MPIVEITPEEDSRLERLAPDYLKGQRNAMRRVRWGLGRLFELVPADPSKSKTEQTAPARTG